MAELVTSESRRYLHGIQKETNETTELPYTVPVDNQVTYIDSFTNYGVDTIYGKEYVIAASSGRAVASGITNTPTGNIAATTVQAAINELDSEKGGLAQDNTWAGSNTFTQALTALQFVKSGGTSNQFLKADGSVDSAVYLTNNQTITISGDASGSGTTAITLALSDTGVTDALLTNYTVGSNTALAATDTVLQAFRKVQGQLNSKQPSGSYQPLDADLTSIAGLAGTSGLLRKTATNTWSLDTTSYEPAISTGTTSQYYRGDKTWQTLNTAAVTESTNLYFTNARVLGTVLTGLNTSLTGAVVASDTILAAIGKLENRVAGFSAAGVSSFNTRAGAVTLTSGDVTGALGFSPSPDTHTHTFASLTSKPTTLSGYGITDAASSTHTHTFASLTSKPTTLSGYGITDAASSTHTHPASSITNTPAGNIAATTVQAAIDELGSEKAQLAAALTNQRVPFANSSGFLTDNSNFYYEAGTGLSISDTTASTSKSTGSLVVGGGVGIGGKLNVGNSIDVVAPYDPNPAGLSSPKMLRLNNGGSISLWVGANGYKDVWMQGIQDDGTNNFKDIRLQPLGGVVRFSGVVRSSGTVPSTSTTTGSLVIDGGVGCGEYFTGKYRSSDGTAGLTATRTFYAASSSGGATNVLNTVTIKDGIITSWTQA